MTLRSTRLDPADVADVDEHPLLVPTDENLVKRRYNIDLGAHMAECDANYLRLMKLMPNRDAADRVFTLPLGASDPVVRLEVTERCRYTTVVEVTQVAPAEGLPGTSLSVRLYHDAKCAEVISFQNERRFEAVYDYPNSKMRHRDEKAQVNRFLSEFLAMCLAHGVSNEEPMPVLSD